INKESFVSEQYDNKGRIIEKYNVSKGNIVGIRYRFDSNGAIIHEIPYDKGKVNGIVRRFNPDGSLERFFSVVKDKHHGEYRIYNRNNPDLLMKSVYINDKKVIRIEGGFHKTKEECNIGISYFYHNKNNGFNPIGSVVYYCSDSSRKQKSCTYYEIFADKLIEHGETYNVKIHFHIGLLEEFNIKLCLGELDEYFNFVNNQDIDTLISDSNVLTFSLDKNDYKRGVNFLMGKIFIYHKNEDITNRYMMEPVENVPYIFYKQFYVK
ncbi:MAG: hypothetical protein MI922_02580, partial [Bacteroidales bacterium]|nr:hypothetical protein [Bacteroidales bacterium]